VYQFPVDIRKQGEGVFESSLADVLGAPTARGDNPASAYQNLVEPAVKHLTLLLAEGRLPTPAAPQGRPTIGFTLPPSGQQPVQGGSKQLNAWDNGNTINYSWRTNVTFWGG
jgi:hypothetical protein